MIDLSQFLDKKVQVKFRNGCICEGKVLLNTTKSQIHNPYYFKNTAYECGYTKDGFEWNCTEPSAGDIIDIQEIKPMTMNKYEELEKQVAEMQKEINRLKAEEKKKPEITIETAYIGDVLEDGSIVVHKTDNMALLAAPAATEVRCEWSNEFTPVFDALKSGGFNPSQWFVPSKEQLQLAYKNCKQHFPSFCYWSSTEVSSTNACTLTFFNSNICSGAKSLSFCVRAFRVVNF
jgi:hypothetical protein